MQAQPDMYTTAQRGECKEGCQHMLRAKELPVSTLLAGIED